MVKSPLAGWVGGKYQLARKIIPRIPEHQCYYEPFAGAAWVLFKKDPSASEVLNDINRDIVTLYRVVQHHLEEFIRWFRWVLVSRDEFERWLRTDPTTLTDIQRAARFYYQQRTSFGGRISGTPTFGYSATRPPRLNLLRIEEELSSVHLRLSRVLIENLPYTDVIVRYDRPETFFYIDPPYFNCETYYGEGVFQRSDFANLADLLGTIKGKCLLSLNDTPEVRQIFEAFSIDQVPVRYTVSRSKQPRTQEVLIANY